MKIQILGRGTTEGHVLGEKLTGYMWEVVVDDKPHGHLSCLCGHIVHWRYKKHNNPDWLLGNQFKWASAAAKHAVLANK